MRLNIYSQELTQEVELVSKRTVRPGGDAVTYYGVRLYLASPEILHHTPEDDDRSAITFWIPHERSFSPGDLRKVFEKMAALCRHLTSNRLYWKGGADAGHGAAE